MDGDVLSGSDEMKLIASSRGYLVELQGTIERAAEMFGTKLHTNEKCRFIVLPPLFENDQALVAAALQSPKTCIVVGFDRDVSTLFLRKSEHFFGIRRMRTLNIVFEGREQIAMKKYERAVRAKAGRFAALLADASAPVRVLFLFVCVFFVITADRIFC